MLFGQDEPESLKDERGAPERMCAVETPEAAGPLPWAPSARGRLQQWLVALGKPLEPREAD